MNYYEYFNEKIEQLIDAGREMSHLVLYPFGKQGMLIKQILNWRYGIEEAFICDEKLSNTNPKIKALNYLEQIDTSKFCFMVTSDNISCYDELRVNLRKYVNDENIIDLFSVKPLSTTNPRIGSLELASREIYNRGIQGAVAEAGVYRGDFAAYINKFFPNRRLYLFDTFEGFAAKDIEVERINKYSSRKEGFYGDTASEIVLDKMIYKNNVVIKKGYFPDTTEGIDEQFCFVSLDMDLYQPIKAGLDYFYPRLCGGGYIFIHDCNIGHAVYKGARTALLEFAEKEKIGYVMLPDNKTAVIVK